jgi:BirA family biotin operon repressor/biotin-[acetyl-CoA-carboxylase] ligase
MRERAPAALGHPRVHLRVTDSTNARARELAAAGAPDGTLVTAAEQTAGRGRQGRRWSAPRGSALLMSLVLRSPPPLLPLLAAVAVCDVAGEETLVKWPNDVVVAAPDGVATGPERALAPPLAKLAGILAEGRLQEGWLVLGIGLNVAVALDALPPELRAGSGRPGGGLPAATMGLRPDDVEHVLERLLVALQGRLAEPAETTLAAWRRRDALRGRPIAWAGGRGRADGIDGEGRLIVALDGGGRTALAAGEVHLEAPA